MKTEKAFVGALVVDSYPFSVGGTAQQAKDLKATGVDALVGYLGSMNPTRLGYLFDAGLAFMPVTTAGDAFNAAAIVDRCKKLGLSADCSVWVDFEGMGVYEAGKDDPLALKLRANQSAIAIQNAHFMPCIYVGAPQPFTSEELYSLQFVRYWKGIGRCVDRFGKLAEPTCGWTMTQAYHGLTDAMGMMWRDIDPSKNGREWKNTNVFVDPNMVGADYRKRLPNWVVA